MINPVVTVALCITALCCLWPNLSHAEEQWYTAGTLSIGAADLHGTSSRGTLGTGELIAGFVDGEFRQSSEVDIVAGLGVSVGRMGPRWGIEVEGLWRVRTDWDLAAPTPSIRTVTNIHTNINNYTLLFNLSRHWGQRGPWQWHLGGGVGVAFNRFQTDYLERAIPGETDETKIRADGNSEEFAWNISAGVSRILSKRWQGRIRYRYIDLGGINVGPFEGRTARIVGRHSVHELQFTLLRLGG